LRRTRGERLLLAGLAAFSLVTPFGCSETRRKWDESRRTPRQWLDIALESQSADERRTAVEHIARSREATSAWAVAAFDSIARTDIDATVRVAALRGLRPGAGPQTVPLLLKLLAGGEPSADVRAAPAIVRWEAAALLRDLGRRGAVDAGQQAEAVDVLIARADHDEDRNVRITALEALGSFREPKVLTALVAALRERDFAIQSAAEQSLTRLTGVSHNYDADEWSAWLSKTPDPFANAPPDGPEPGGKREWWSRMWG
jgi:HEAT repeat protein